MRKIIKPCGLHCIKIKHLGVTIGGKEILTDINLHIHCGSLNAVIGKNGAGKSTLIKAILGELPHTGSIEFMPLRKKASRSISPGGHMPAMTLSDQNADSHMPAMTLSDQNADGCQERDKGQIQKLKIGYVPQTVNIEKQAPVSVYDLMASYLSRFPVFLWKKKSVYHMIKEGLKIFEADHLIDQQLGRLSGGELQRVLLSLAVMGEPNLLLLDEPVSGIDQNGMELFYKLMDYLKKNFDLAVILISHDLDYVAEYADHVVLLDQTVLKQGTAREVYQSEAFQQVFGKAGIHVQE